MFYSWVVCTVYCAVLPAFSFYQKSYDSVPILGEKQVFYAGDKSFYNKNSVYTYCGYSV